MRDWTKAFQDSDIDIVDMYDTYITPDEKEDIVEILYEYFLQGITKGKRIIEIGEVDLEVNIEDYEEELTERLEQDIDLDYEDVKFIAKELNNPEILANWMKNKEYQT